MSIEEVENFFVKVGNLKPLCEWYEMFDKFDQRIIEEATIKHMNIFNKALIEIISSLLESLYEVLELRRLSSRTEQENLRKRILVDLCPEMSIEEMNSLLENSKKQFKRKTRVNKLMIGEFDVVVNETKKFLEVFLSKN